MFGTFDIDFAKYHAHDVMVWERCYSNSISELLDEKVGWKKGGKWEAKIRRTKPGKSTP